MIEQNIPLLKIHKLTQEQYERQVAADTVEENAIYLTPTPDVDNFPVENSENLITSGGVFEALQTIAVPDFSVTSVNGKIGDVELTAEDVGALPDTTEIPTVPTNVSEFENDAGYLTEHQSLDNYALKSELENKQNKLTFDTVPTPDSTNPITSGAAYNAVVQALLLAEGKCKSFVFDTVADLDTFLSDSNNTSDLNTGDVFLIRAIDVPDYWWDKTTNSKQILETTKVDLNSYALKSEIPTVPTNISAFTNDTGYALTSQIPTIPTSLPANGGNADTVDNYHIRIVTTDDGGQAGSITFVIG